MSAGIGAAAAQPDHLAKVLGEFRYASDLGSADAVWAATVRSPHAHARIDSIDSTAARRLPGVLDVITAADIPGRKLFGQMKVDQPVLAMDVVRHHGEPVAVVAATDPDTARLAADRVAVGYSVLPPVTDPVAALRPDSPAVHSGGNLLSSKRIRRGAAQQGGLPPADVVVRGEYTVGMQDPAFLGPEAGLALPTEAGGVELRVATQWLHLDQEQLAASLGLPADRVVVKPAGVGGAFGGREDLSVHVPACLLALRLRRPVLMWYPRAESFLAHVHRHPAVLRYEHGCTASGRLVYVRAEIVLDGGAYASSSPAIAGNAATHAAGPYDVPHAWIDASVAYTNNPPAGAMRGFGTVQPCFAYESQMDRLAVATGLDPVEIRVRNALRTGASLPTGQVLTGPAPVAELLGRLKALPAPADPPADSGAVLARGIGYAAGLKNIAFSEGFDDYSTARVRLRVVDGRPVAEVTCAAVEVGQGVLGVQRQIVVSELGVTDVRIEQADTRFGTAGPTSASRQTYVTGGAVRAACRAVRDAVRELAGSNTARCDGTLATVLGDRVIERTAEFHHPPTVPLDPVHGQGNSAMQFGFAAHRAVVDVDVELGLITVVELATAQDVGRAMNPLALAGQLQGGAAQGLGLALTEELVLVDGTVANPSFATYQLPTTMDVPRLRAEILELPDPAAPYGLRGIGELPAISSTAAIAAAVRAATGRPVRRVPIRPEHLVDPEDHP
ncbi:MAG TPA: molybdopterin cofactor-binding domain-containing protein [Actinophytocola sp.]|uniref:xanthine dehydrogenase family protein molybdopterin-binding subunit n=1 Tax=Actinophytocola sp. TaxID=1872138 RepID=UPI002DB66F76|nr:molybdopterin cofactor-binding domain-containing protein [Actinophytocola sp.]HEU5470952.1 molybdopterin cofactor-binding domain-containing protein [Actinophytocola sp.]